jgi:hypothetical protein
VKRHSKHLLNSRAVTTWYAILSHPPSCSPDGLLSELSYAPGKGIERGGVFILFLISASYELGSRK